MKNMSFMLELLKLKPKSLFLFKNRWHETRHMRIDKSSSTFKG